MIRFYYYLMLWPCLLAVISPFVSLYIKCSASLNILCCGVFSPVYFELSSMCTIAKKVKNFMSK